MNYILTVLIIAGILWLFGHLCKRHGEWLGFEAGREYERGDAQARAKASARTRHGFWMSQN